MNTKLGLFGIVGVWFTMAMMPIAQLLPSGTLSAYDLLFMRGAPAVLVLGAAGLFRKEWKVSFPDRETLRLVLLFALATFGLFKGILAWGANLSAVLLDMAVLVNFTIAAIRGERIGRHNMLVFTIAIIGSFMALRIWDTEHLNIEGLSWSILALVANGLFIECAGKAKQNFSTKIFWLSVGLTIGGLTLTPLHAWELDIPQTTLLVWFGIATGLINFLCGFTAFANLKAVWVGTLVLGVTPFIILSSWLMLGVTLGIDQLVGVALTLFAVGSLGYALGAMKQNVTVQ